MGHTVEVLKSFVQEEFDIPMTVSQLYIGEKLMLNPLSLSDYPEIHPSRPGLHKGRCRGSEVARWLRLDAKWEDGGLNSRRYGQCFESVKNDVVDVVLS